MDERKLKFNRIYKRGTDQAQAGKADAAAAAFSQALGFAPDLWCEVATRLAKEGEDVAALDHFKAALQGTNHAGLKSGIFNNIAVIYVRRGQLKEALEMIDLALQADRDNVDALCNLGQIRKWEGNLEASNRYVARVLERNPWHNEAQLLQALNRLDCGDYKRGFELYECRWRSKSNRWRKLEAPFPEWAGPGATWRGRPLKRIFVYGEQGAGDIFLMLRYAPLLRALGMWQRWAVKPKMAALLASVVDAVTEDGDQPLDFDCHIPSASLPRVFGTTLETIPVCGYIPTPMVRAEKKGLSVGICWRGNKGQYNDGIRSTNLEHWRPVLEVPGVNFYSLQVDGALEALGYPEVSVPDEPADWLETARRLAGLDLIISVDTAIVHLAGAMGLPVWCALHCRPYFVFPVGFEGTPWYPSVRLFKQQKAFEWKPVFERIASELEAFTKTGA